MLPISVCIIVKNEESRLGRCLESIKEYGFEIIVADTGSTDKTREIAESYGARVFDFAWCDDFSAARNFSIRQASFDWIFVLDSDETIERLNLEEMEYFRKHLQQAAGSVTRRNQITKESGVTFQTDNTERFFSRKYYHYTGRIHEQLTPRHGREMQCFLLNTVLWHDGYDMTQQQRREKADRNISLLEKQIGEEGAGPYLYYQLAKGYEIREDYAQACIYFDKALEYDVDTGLAYVQEMITSYGDDLLRIGEKEAALGLEAVYESFQESADFLYLMGRIYQENGWYDKALIEYGKAAEKETASQEGANSYLPYYHMAMIYAGRGQKEKALQMAEKCGRYQPAEVLLRKLWEYQSPKTLAVFVATHVAFQPPKSPVYIPLHVGRAGKEDFGYLGDNIGENISDLNCLYGELTGLYWIWQNIRDIDYVGLCHYRRYFLSASGREMQREDYLKLLARYDVIVSAHIECRGSYRAHYGRAHNIQDLQAVERALHKLYPEYADSFQKAMEGTVFYSGNLFVTSLSLLKGYAQWLFSIFAEASAEIDVSSYDNYHRRVYGFLSEQMMYVYMMKNGLTYCEVPVEISEEKAETRQLKEKLGRLLQERKLHEARALFEAVLKERPDVMLAGSDIYEELRALYQIIHLCLTEEKEGKDSLLEYSTEVQKLLVHYKRILEILRNRKQETVQEADLEYLRENKVSDSVLNEIIRCTPSLQREPD